MIEASSLPPGTPIFTHVLPDGENVSIHVQPLRKLVVLNRAYDRHIKRAPLDRQLASSFIRDNIVSPSRIAELLHRHDTLERLLRMEPVMFCETGTHTNGAPDIFFVDGHHRYVMCAALELPVVPCYMIPFDFWQQFRIRGCLPLTSDQLRSLPITERKY